MKSLVTHQSILTCICSAAVLEWFWAHQCARWWDDARWRQTASPPPPVLPSHRAFSYKWVQRSRLMGTPLRLLSNWHTLKCKSINQLNNSIIFSLTLEFPLFPADQHTAWHNSATRNDWKTKLNKYNKLDYIQSAN